MAKKKASGRRMGNQRGIMLWVPTDLYDEIERRAKELGLPVSSYIRLRMLGLVQPERIKSLLWGDVEAAKPPAARKD